MLKIILLFLYSISISLHEGHALVKDSRPHNSFILLGASGDLSKRKIYPALWTLYRDNLLLPNTRFFGFARTPRSVDYIRNNCEPYVTLRPGEEQLYDEFWKFNYFVNGTDGGEQDYAVIDQFVEKFEDGQEGNRIFYMAIPPDIFPNASRFIKKNAMSKRGYTRVVIEKPFGRDSESGKELADIVEQLYTEDQVYRLDSFLGYDIVKNLVLLRFGNRIFMPGWNKENVASVKIDFAEDIGVEGRGNFFDRNGVIRDVVQNHLLQLLSVIAMDEPASLHPDEIKNAKVELLKSIKEIVMDDVVIGQYIANPDSKDSKQKIGYRDDPTVPNDSITATFSLTILKIENERWKGVPFIIRSGKGLNANRNQAIIQFKNASKNLFGNQLKRNELVIKLTDPHALETKIASKVPGYSNDVENISIDVNFSKLHPGIQIPKPYETLIRDVFKGSQSNFARADELLEAWRIFTPILHEIEEKKIRPIEYKFGSDGPLQADEMEKKNNFLH
ncbi:glucose-6-phosphate 1-dehydrogenase-like isoform X3 [Phymastichus coffea]|uniref:glucose-6-phosphate 1-dehydrogenase-like isoform X3 n=1 Tax=Phymastichus coffea TaxID=108790 RepID=UPI00273B29ED|nr:glucose-6-phosphate 1-dehydrogenase-like isoform X3 [Phymastichus coffea]XP_058798900.1 glucose-6-phosphate 1-dehydrogenase-like isoform X3 [Phymastichus coffea]